MTDIQSPPDSYEVAKTILRDERNFELRARDVALLVLIRDHVQGRQDLGFSITKGEIRVLSQRVDDMDACDPLGAEKRLTESINRLLKAECVARADMGQLRRERDDDDTEYQITTLGESHVTWNVGHSRFSGEPLEAILRAFNLQLEHLAALARKITTIEAWRDQIVAPLQYVLKNMLVDVQRHQRDLDHKHEELRDFIPSLFKKTSEVSIEQCEARLRQVILTIEDLQRVTLDETNAAYSHMDRILTRATEASIADIEPACVDISRRLQTVNQWTVQRVKDWVEYHTFVHNYLRSVIRVDRQRRLTEALNRAIAVIPNWTLRVPDEARLLRLRDSERGESSPRRAPRRPRTELAGETVEIPVDHWPERLEALFRKAMAQGLANWSTILGWAAGEGAPRDILISHLPFLQRLMVENGRLDETARGWVPAGRDLEVEELRVERK